MVLQSHTRHSHTHKRTHWYYIEDFFMGSCQLLHWVRSCVSQFYWFVTLPNHSRRKNCKKKRRESQRKSARNYGSDSAGLLYVCMYVLSYHWQWTVRADEVPKKWKRQMSNVLNLSQSWSFFSHLNLYQTKIWFRFDYNGIRYNI